MKFERTGNPKGSLNIGNRLFQIHGNLVDDLKCLNFIKLDPDTHRKILYNDESSDWPALPAEVHCIKDILGLYYWPASRQQDQILIVFYYNSNNNTIDSLYYEKSNIKVSNDHDPIFYWNKILLGFQGTPEEMFFWFETWIKLGLQNKETREYPDLKTIKT